MTMIIRPTPGALAALLFTAAMPTAAPATALPVLRQDGIHAIGSRDGSVCLPALGRRRDARNVAGCPSARAAGEARLQREPSEFPSTLLGWVLSGLPGPP